MSPLTEESIRCTVGGCGCECFVPGSVQHRSCDHCGHGWVAHALDKFQPQAQCPSSSEPVEVALPGAVFDLSSLVLYGSQAIPVRLKILLDRLYSVLTPDQVADIIETLGWSLGDYIRGYMLQFDGMVLDHWVMMSAEEELLILRQFLRFGETRPIVHHLVTAYHLSIVPSSCPPFHGDTEQDRYPESCQSNMERGRAVGALGTLGVFLRGRSKSAATSVGHFDKKKNPPGNTAHHFENFPGRGLSPLLLPFHPPSAASHFLLELAPPTKDNTPPTKLSRQPQKTSEFNLRQRQASGRVNRKRVERESTSLLSSLFPFNRDSVDKTVRIKSDPDAVSSPAPSPTHLQWQQNDNLPKGVAKQETNLSSSPLLPPSLHSSLLPSLSSSLQSSLYSSPSEAFQKLHPLSITLSSSASLPLSSPYLHPIPSSSFSLPLSAGGRKGRVCCSVCGKSFYDKGTLKIHYNAVHLKIKHRCTVKGCNMVFSSLRSRNRHSANPNPRLHTHTNTNMPLHTLTDTHTNTQTSPRQRTHIYAHSDLRLHNNKDTIIHDDTLSHLQPHSRVQRDTHTHRQSSRNTHAVPHLSSQLHTHRHTHRDHSAHAAKLEHTDAHTEEMYLRDRQTHTQSNTTDEQRSTDVDIHQHMQITETGRAEAHTHCQHTHTHGQTNSVTTVPQNGLLSPEHPDPQPSQPLLSSHGASSLGFASPVFPPTPPSLAVGPRQTENQHQQHPIRLHPPQNTSPPLPAGPSPMTMGTSQSATSNHPDAPQLINLQSRWGSGDPVPKKKPRKSSMPVKIERGERTEDREEKKEEL